MSDPFTLIASALVAAAAALSQGVLSEGAKDLYKALRSLVDRKLRNNPIATLDKQAHTSNDVAQLTSKLKAESSQPDAAVLALAAELMRLMQKENPDVLRAVGVQNQGDLNTFASSGSIAVGGNAKNVSISTHRDMPDRIASYSPSHSATNTSSVGQPPTVGTILFGLLFAGFAVFWISGVESHPMGGGAGFLIGTPFLLVGLGVTAYGIYKFASFHGSKVSTLVAGVVSVHIPNQGIAKVTLLLKDGRRLECTARDSVARSVGIGEVGVAHVKDYVLVDFRQ